MSHEDINDDDWMEEAPLLASLKGAVPQAEVPEGYFEELPSRVMDRIRNSEFQAESVKGSGSEKSGQTIRPQSTRLRSKWRAWGMAASILVLAGLGIAFLALNRDISEEAFDQQIQSQLVSVSDDNILDQLDLSDISEQELYEALGQEGQSALEEELNGLGQDNLLDLLDDLDLDTGDLDGIDFDEEFFNEFEL
jgi:hypothetical protein